MAAELLLQLDSTPHLGKTCGICQTAIAAEETVGVCPECAAPFHEECWNEIGGCAVYGCPAMPRAEKEEAGGGPHSHWGQETKECPQCGASIRVAALRCRNCGALFDNEDPVSRSEYLRGRTDRSREASTRRTTSILFGLSLVPCFAPLVFPVALIWHWRRRADLRRASRHHHALSVIALVASGAVTLLLAVVLVVHVLAG